MGMRGGAVVVVKGDPLAWPAINKSGQAYTIPTMRKWFIFIFYFLFFYFYSFILFFIFYFIYFFYLKVVSPQA
jgi:hypothetical protein